MRILHVLDHSLPLHSGYAFRSASILRFQRDLLGWETCQLTGIKQGTAADGLEEVDGVEYFRTGLPSSFWRHPSSSNPWLTVTSMARRLDSVIALCRPTIIHAHSPALNGVAAWWAARRHRLPLVYESRGLWEDAAVSHGTTRQDDLRYRLSRGLESWVFQRADAVVTLGEGMRQEILGRGVGAAKVTVLPNAVDSDLFPEVSPSPALVMALRRQLGLVDKRVIAFIGSFYSYEGLDLLVAALPAMVARHPRVALLLVGGGPEEERLRQLVAMAGLEDRVTFAGRIAHAQIPHYYYLAECLVYPRRGSRLTELVTPLKPLEAMAAGRAVVASDVGGHREMIIHGETGLLHRPDDPEDLAAAVSRLLDDDMLAAILQEQARAYVLAERQWRTVIPLYRGTYRLAAPGMEIP